jgi:p-aminobenzoyl-glutamate transporter AbgT
MPKSGSPRPGALERALRVIERGGNALPHPATLFAIMAGEDDHAGEHPSVALEG